METYLLNDRDRPNLVNFEGPPPEESVHNYRVVFDDHQQLWRVDAMAHSPADAGRAVAFAQGLETPAILAIIDVATLR